MKKIRFGKYEKPHVCNLRKFKIFGGTEESCGFLLLEAGLKNDSTAETFDLKHRTASSELLPIRYLKILPLLSWGPCFNFSIWYVELLGTDDAMCVSLSLKSYTIEREAEIIRLCLKYFRQQGYDKAFEALQDQTNVQLEHPMMKELHQSVVEGNFAKAETHIEEMINQGLMDAWLQAQHYSVEWKQIDPSSARPGKRGGHQLVFDPNSRVIYLYGGWNGNEDLSDMWMYDLKKKQWSLIHEKSEAIGGPSPRACHKMVFDPNNSQIFMLGKYIDTSSRIKDKLKSDFYLYDTKTSTWLLICDNTADFGGPQLVYDHQMCIDAARRTLFVFGGRILTTNQDDLSSEQNYSGLYAYHISDNVWNLLLVDCGHPSASNPDVNSIKSRTTHLMLFNDKNRKLYIFGGQRGKEYMTDFLTYDVETQEVANLTTVENLDTKNVPQSGMTQRATIDTDRDEIYVLTSLRKEKDRREMNLSIWMYSLKRQEWSCIYRSDGNIANKQTICPCPRYAHQLVLDPVEKIHYLFGGNPGVQSHERLDDFWTLNLQKPNREHVLRKCRYLIRTLEYEELARKDAVAGLQYLQTNLSQVIDRHNEAQLKEFHKLTTLLFKTPDATPSSSKTVSPCFDDSSKESMESVRATDDLYAYNIDQVTQMSNRQSDEIQRNRYVLYNKLIELLPEKLCQPKANLNDFVLI